LVRDRNQTIGSFWRHQSDENYGAFGQGVVEQQLFLPALGPEQVGLLDKKDTVQAPS
jgi:hypothetical protein